MKLFKGRSRLNIVSRSQTAFFRFSLWWHKEKRKKAVWLRETRLNISKYFFSNHIVDRWKGLPEYVINADSTNSFKNRLDNYWKMTGCGYLQRPLA